MEYVYKALVDGVEKTYPTFTDFWSQEEGKGTRTVRFELPDGYYEDITIGHDGSVNLEVGSVELSDHYEWFYPEEDEWVDSSETEPHLVVHGNYIYHYDTDIDLLEARDYILASKPYAIDPTHIFNCLKSIRDELKCEAEGVAQEEQVWKPSNSKENSDILSVEKLGKYRATDNRNIYFYRDNGQYYVKSDWKDETVSPISEEEAYHIAFYENNNLTPAQKRLISRDYFRYIEWEEEQKGKE